MLDSGLQELVLDAGEGLGCSDGGWTQTMVTGMWSEGVCHLLATVLRTRRGISEKARPFAYSLFRRLPQRGWGGVFWNSISFERRSLGFMDIGLAWEGCWGPRSWNMCIHGWRL